MSSFINIIICFKYFTFSIKLRDLFVNLVTLLFIYHRSGKHIVESCWSSGMVHSFQTAVPGSIPGDICCVSLLIFRRF